MSIFSSIEPIRFEGPATRNEFAYRVYDKDRMVLGKRMEEWLKVAVCYWHSFNWPGVDIFGGGTLTRPWLGAAVTQAMAEEKLDAAFDFMARLGVPYFTFHDVDVMATATTIKDHNGNLRRIEAEIAKKMAATGIKLLWGTANLFSNPRYVHGAATSPNADSFAYASAQVKKALEVTKELGGAGYTFWGGREGYQTLWNTDMKREFDHLAKFMHMAVDYAREIGFKGQFYFEPKPKEPTKHQYDYDCAACINFLRAYGLADYVKMNIETNHATLAGHSVEHEMDYAGAQGFLGSVDANTGDLLLGWDTDQFPTDVYLTTKMMLVLLKYGGFTTGGLNFDAKVRRESFEPVDLFHAHIGGMDAFAKGLKIAAAIRADGEIDRMLKQRYSSWDSGVGAEIEAGKQTFASLEKYMLAKGDVTPNTSGRQELLENVMNRYVF